MTVGMDEMVLQRMAWPLAAGVLTPAAIVALCVLAGVGTILVLPGRREGAIRKIGGAVLAGVFFIFIAVLVRQGTGGGAGEVYFWIFSIIAIFAASRVVSHPRPVYSALYFVLTVLASAGLFILLWAEFMAAALVLIYAGAILVTYVFVIMLASQAQAGAAGETGESGAEYDRVSREPLIASIAGFALMGVMIFVIFEKGSGLVGPASAANTNSMTATQPTLEPANPGTAMTSVVGETSAVRQLGEYLFREQLLTLELAGLILTLGMVGAVVIARQQVTEIGVEAIGDATEMEQLKTLEADGNPHSIPVYGTTNHQAKAYPEH